MNLHYSTSSRSVLTQLCAHTFGSNQVYSCYQGRIQDFQIEGGRAQKVMCAYTLKTTGSEIDPERVHWGQTPFRVNDDPEISQLDAKCDPELGQSDPIICQVCRKLTNFLVIFDPEWSLAPMDPFPGHADSGVFRV